MQTLPATVSSKVVRVLLGGVTRSTNFREVGGTLTSAQISRRKPVSL
jgi:hypothetical protein